MSITMFIYYNVVKNVLFLSAFVQLILHRAFRLTCSATIDNNNSKPPHNLHVLVSLSQTFTFKLDF